MIKLTPDISNKIYPSILSNCVDAVNNYFLMVLTNLQTKEVISKVVNKGVVSERSVELSLDDVVLRLNGTDDYIDIDNMVGAYENGDAFTIAFWVKSISDEETNPWENIAFSAADAGNSQDILKIGIASSSQTNGAIHLGVGSSSENIGSGYNDKLWHRVVVTRASGAQKKLTVFVDGVKLGLTTFTYTVDWDSATKMAIGQEFDGFNPSDYFDGYIKDVQLWNTCFEESDVLYDFKNPDKLAWENDKGNISKYALLAHYKINEGSGTVVKNSEPNNYISNANDFTKWTQILCNIKSNVIENFSGIKNADLVTYKPQPQNPQGQAAIQTTAQSVNKTGTWYFGLWIKGKGSSIGKKCRLNIDLNGVGGAVFPTTTTYTKDWEFHTCYAILTELGAVKMDFEAFYNQEGSLTAPKEGDEAYICGAEFYDTTTRDGSIVTEFGGTPDWGTRSDLMYSLQGNSFYKYDIYEQTNKSNVDFENSAVLGLRQTGKAWVSGNSEVKYVAQEENDSKNSVYLKA